MIENKNERLDIRGLSILEPGRGDIGLFDFNPYVDFSPEQRSSILNGAIFRLNWYAGVRPKIGEGNIVQALINSHNIFPQEIQDLVSNKHWDGLKKSFEAKNNISYERSQVLLLMRLLSPEKFERDFGSPLTNWSKPFYLHGFQYVIREGMDDNQIRRILKVATAARILSPRFFEKHIKYTDETWELIESSISDVPTTNDTNEWVTSLPDIKIVNPILFDKIAEKKDFMTDIWISILAEWKDVGGKLNKSRKVTDWERFVELSKTMSLLSTNLQIPDSGGLVLLYQKGQKFKRTNKNVPEVRKF